MPAISRAGGGTVGKYTPPRFREQTGTAAAKIAIHTAKLGWMLVTVGPLGVGVWEELRSMLVSYNRHNPDFRQGLPILLNWQLRRIRYYPHLHLPRRAWALMRPGAHVARHRVVWGIR
jgi:hypothetical protein